MQNLATCMNFTPLIRQPLDGKEFGYKTESGFTRSIGDLVYNMADISGNERCIKYYGIPMIDFTMPAFYTTELVVVVPKAQQIPSWKAISLCFSFQFWMCLLATFLVTEMLWYVLRQMHGEFPCPTNVADMMAVILTMSLSFLTKISASSQRLLLSSCFLFSLVIMCVLQSSHPHFQSDLDTLQKLESCYC
jgi:hypothetical protein